MKINKQKRKKIDVRYLVITRLFDAISLSAFIFTIVHLIVHRHMELPGIASSIVCFVFGLANLIFIRKQARLDPLTKIPGSELIVLFAVRKFIRRKLSNYTSIFLNMKNTRFLNRMYGSKITDEIIHSYAQTLKSFLTQNENVGRMGGDNFVILIYKHRLNDFLKKLSEVAITINVEGTKKTIPIEARCGLYSLTTHDTPEDVFNKTNMALNFAKARKVENIAWYKNEMSAALFKEKDITFNFDDAIANKQFKVVYQPVYNGRSDSLHSAEALVRWERNGALLPPENFLPALEATGLISKLDFYVLETVCQNLVEWKKAGLNLRPIAVNFSSIHLEDSNFSTQILEVVNKYELDRSLINIELTRSDSFSNFRALQGFLAQMSESKIEVIIDNFGTQFSAFELLKNPFLHCIKIDRSLIAGIEAEGGSTRQTILVKNLINTCHDLRVSYICCGIENQTQKDLLLGMRTALFQGYYFDMPLSKEDFANRLKD